MYKVVYKNIVIDVLKDLKYMRFLPKSKHVVMTDKSSANCVLSSDKSEKYHVNGMPYPDGSDYKTVSLVKISESEYNKLYDLLKNGSSICDNEILLNNTRKKKIEEMSNACNKAIVDGVTVVFSDNKPHHFRLTIEDQLNLISLKSLIDSGHQEILYHETDSLCKTYIAEDILLLIKISEEHKLYHTTYFNRLKHHIRNLYDLEQIRSIEYGVKI